MAELSTGYHNMAKAFAETYWKPNLDKFQLATILELFLGRTAAPEMYRELKRLVEYHQRTKVAIPCLADAIQALAKADGK